MKIIICSSIDFTDKIIEVKKELETLGHQVHIPFTSNRILNGEFTLEDFRKEKQEYGDGSFRKIQDDVIKKYFKLIREHDLVLIINEEKKGIKGYIGGNTFLEMGFAHVQDKPLYLYNDIPKMPYYDELIAMSPTVINGDLTKLK